MSDRTRQQILVVDDEPDVLQSTEMMLNLLGFDALPLLDPTEVVELAARKRPSVILQDLRMPHLDLPRLVRRLRSNPSTKDIPIVFFSAAPEIDQVAARLDADAFLRKPFDPGELGTVIRRSMAAQATLPSADVAHASPLDVLFHEYWNAFTAVNTAAQTLGRSPGLSHQDRHVMDQVDRLLLKLEREAFALQHELGEARFVHG